MGGRVQGFWNSDSIRTDVYKRASHPDLGDIFFLIFFLTEELCHWRNLRNWSYTKSVTQVNFYFKEKTGNRQAE